MAVNSRQLSLFEHRALPNSSSSNKNTCRFGWCQIPPLSETPSKNGYISYIYIYTPILRFLNVSPLYKLYRLYPHDVCHGQKLACNIHIRGWSGDPWPTISHYKDSHCWMHDHKPYIDIPSSDHVTYADYIPINPCKISINPYKSCSNPFKTTIHIQILLRSL